MPISRELVEGQTAQSLLSGQLDGISCLLLKTNKGNIKERGERKGSGKQRKLEFLNGLLYQPDLHSLHQQPGHLSSIPSKEPASRYSASFLAYLSHLQLVSQPDFFPQFLLH